MSQDHALQTSFLQALSESKVIVSIFLINGIKLHGTIEQVVVPSRNPLL